MGLGLFTSALAHKFQQLSLMRILARALFVEVARSAASFMDGCGEAKFVATSLHARSNFLATSSNLACKEQKGCSEMQQSSFGQNSVKVGIVKKREKKVIRMGLSIVEHFSGLCGNICSLSRSPPTPF